MAADREVWDPIKLRFAKRRNTLLFIQNANTFMVTHSVPGNVRELFLMAFDNASYEDVVKVTRELMGIMSEYESVAVALRFGNSLPPKLVQELREQLAQISENAYQWANETCAYLELGCIDKQLEAVKKWLVWKDEQPNKSQIELDCQALVENLKAVPADQFTF
jgi:hypothetical protein